MHFCPPKTLYPGWADLKVGRAKYNPTYLAHPLQKSYRCPWLDDVGYMLDDAGSMLDDVECMLDVC